MSYLLDTNIVSGIINQNERVANKFRDLLFQKQAMFFSCITYFEILGGLLAKNASSKQYRFERLCQNDLTIIYLPDRDILDRAAQIYAELRRAGTPVGTADILIAATAIARGLILVSHDSDMQRIRGVTLEDWLASN